MPPPPPPPMPENGRYFSGPRESTSSSLLLCLNIVNTLTHLLLGAIAFAAIALAAVYSFTTTLQQHVVLCVIGYIILMSQAVLTMSPSTGWSSMLKYQERRNVHWIMQILGSVLAIAGSIVRITGLTDHFQSAHGALGILAFVFACVSLVGGIVNLLCNNLPIDPKFLKISHALVGCITLTLAFLALMFGFDKAVSRLQFSDAGANMFMAFTVFALLGTLTPACFSMVGRLKK